MTMRPNRAVAAIVFVAVLGGAAITGVLAPTAAQQPAPPAAPYRVGYVSAATTGLVQATGDALPPGAGGVDSDASAGKGGLAWVSKRAVRDGAERDGEIWYLRDGTRVPVRLTDDATADTRPALSPDGSSIAFVSERTGSKDIFVIGVDGRGLRQVTSGPAADDSPSWSPDGGRLVFSGTGEDPAGDLYTVPSGGGAPTRLTNDPGADTEPAWAPTGSRIAFTTTRFDPAGDVVVMAETGGAVTRAVPEPGDSSEPAWSPDGARLAFTTRQPDPLGDVKQVAGGQVSVISALSGVGETEPTFRADGQPVFTRLHGGATTDIWSSDARGGDRRDLTNRPDADEADPAFSPDGTSLAYTEFGTGESRNSQVVVANADGDAPRPLTAAERGKRERHPAWSPDATKIAFTRTVSSGEGSDSFVRIVRVADGRPLGDIPIPAHLRGDDSQPVWSADGTKITLTRAATRIGPPGPSRVDPAVVDVPVGRGGSARIGKTVETDRIRSLPDVVLLMDQTGSMGGVIEDVKTNLGAVIDSVREREKEANFAVVAFGDAKDPAPRPFHVQQPLTPAGTDAERKLLSDAFARIKSDGGGDTAEDWLLALRKIATGAITFRPGSSRVIVLVGDAASHETPPDTRAEVIAALNAAKISVVAVPAVTGGPSTDPDRGLDARGQATAITSATNGVLTPGTDPGRISEAIIAGIGDLPVSVQPVSFCDPGLTMTFDPAGPQSVPGGAKARFTETATVSQTAALGSFLRCRVEFRLNGETTVRPGYTENVTVRVKDPALPLITLHDRTVTGTGPMVIEYPATAVDVDGSRLEPSCVPLSGSLFPVGATTVACTARGKNGTAVETAVMAVAPPGEDRRRQLWQVTLTQPSPDVVVPGDQRDLSSLFGPGCGTGEEGAADVSPDGATLAFQSGYGLVCVAPADGGAARILVQRTGYVDDPAWSPDGGLVAYTNSPSEDPPRIAVVPFTGGDGRILIDGPGGASQPTFQRIPDLAVSTSAVPAAIPFEGLTTVEFVVTNRGATASPVVGLFVRLTAGLRPSAAIPTKGTCTPELVCAFGTLVPGEEVRVRFGATGLAAGAQAATGTATTTAPDADTRDNSATAVVTVGEKPAPPVTPGSLSVGMSVSAVPLFTGGDDVVLTYLVHNGSQAAMPAVRLVTQLPPGLPATSAAPGCVPGGGSCALGTLGPGQTVAVRISLAAKAAFEGQVSGTVSTTGPDNNAADNTANARVVVRQPVVELDPKIGTLGFVPRVRGTDFPPGAVVRLAWSAGISAPGLVTVGADGRFEARFLIFHHDLIGPRTVNVTSVGGVKFGTVGSNPILVVLRTQQPPFITRG
ncbi:DPP IV N-terminal domain-containing protein [Amycolatopsis sp. EV170708-02-1]|uniref:DPP IV N-terminal domain-containing protein n=1 Tax=Amycolatopsis sp. EV170708-02-1 TaxID=2919322 RepID=UPI001F0C438C|nr:VWA domain-containing protein [Amycolatopsis sp. EV170708-02-1]UMP03460.1 DPP IV N-terminal domain-containing protein [Amycolatopsis sp. EV170708-02-1]